MAAQKAIRGETVSDVLAGIRVLDFGRYVAGPYCATLLGDFGADVIRIERVGGGEDRFLVPVGEAGDGAMFLAMSRNKRGLTLDPMTPEGREIVRRLVRTADVVVVNMPAPALASMGLDYDSLKAEKPDIILALATAFGSTGPYAHKLGFDAIGQAMSGAMYLTGTQDRPQRAMATYSDYGTAMFLAFGVMAALMERQKSGQGQMVEGALMATGLSFLGTYLIEQGVRAPNRIAQGSRSQQTGPADVFKCKDGWITVMTVGDPLFRRWTKLIGEPHWLDDPRFKDDQGRGDHGAVLSERMALWCGQRDAAQALAELEKAGLPAAPILSPQQAIDDPQAVAAQFLKPIEYPGLPKPAPVPNVPVRLSRTPGRIRARPPTLGEHTDAILAELGYDAAAIATLRDKKVV